jgi:hypothetical protein
MFQYNIGPNDVLVEGIEIFTQKILMLGFNF